MWGSGAEKGQHGGLNEDRKTIAFPLDHCIIFSPCKAPPEQGLTPCPGRLGTAQTRETEARSAAETSEDPNPLSEPHQVPQTPYATARAGTGTPMPNLTAPSPQTTASTLGCP